MLSLQRLWNNTEIMETTNNNIAESHITGLKGILKVFPTKGFYLSAEVGAGFGVQEGVGTGFLYSPGLGVAFAKNYDISARYEAVNFKNDVTLGQVALRLAYAFSL